MEQLKWATSSLHFMTRRSRVVRERPFGENSWLHIKKLQTFLGQFNVDVKAGNPDRCLWNETWHLSPHPLQMKQLQNRRQYADIVFEIERMDSKGTSWQSHFYSYKWMIRRPKNGQRCWNVYVLSISRSRIHRWVESWPRETRLSKKILAGLSKQNEINLKLSLPWKL